MSMSKDAIVHQIQQAFPECKIVYLFGSHASGHQHSESDLDIAIWCGKSIDNVQRWKVAQAIAAQAGCDVDLVDLADCSMILKHEILNKGIKLFDDGSAAVFENTFDRMFLDFNYHHQQYVAHFVKDRLGDIEHG